MFERILKLPELLKQKSFFVFGPRATGKTSLINEQLNGKAVIINLLKMNYFRLLSSKPEDLESIIDADENHSEWVVIDEIQLIPELLNEVHRLIEERKFKFLLTGSSARKLKAKGINLLAGRAWKAELFPLTRQEIPDFNLERYLQYGGLPSVYLSEMPQEELDAYVHMYLREEIQAEAFVRNVQTYTHFLEMSALSSGDSLNFAAISNESGIPATTIREYYQLLEDTLMGFMLPVWQKSKKRKPASAAKFYYFDLGVRNTLCQFQSIDPRSDVYGQAFEHFIINEIRAFLSYRRIKKPLTHWRTHQGDEVDVLIGDDVAIEIKSTKKVQDKHLKGLLKLQEENVFQKYILVSKDPIPRVKNDVLMLPWESFFKRLYKGEFV